MKDLKYSDILRMNKNMEADLCGNKYNIAVLSNLIISPQKEILEYALRTHGLNVHVALGDYDNIVQDSVKFKESNIVVIFWELINIIDGFQYKSNLMGKKERSNLISKVKSEIDFVFSNLQETSLVLFNRFSSLVFNVKSLKQNGLDEVCEELNKYIDQKNQKNVIFVDIDKIIANISVGKVADFRFFYSSKALYTVEFYKEYSEFVEPIILSANGQIKKVLIFDCDNTLWKGILGEDGFNGIEMSSKTSQGAIYEEVQNIALDLNQKGVLLGLCSKNNPEDVDDVLKNHPDIKLKDEYLTIKKVNWKDKAENLRAIARELNLGLDSFVFVDDSDFEVNYIRNTLPQVTVLQRPVQLHEYPKFLRDHIGLFFNISESKEDTKKGQMYKEQTQRGILQSEFKDIEDYLKSLNLDLTVFTDNHEIIPRMAQMTQKTNQFNLTTKRYTEADIKKDIEDKNYKVFAFEVKDKLGSYGVTGLAITAINRAERSAEIDTMLMSCRVIGRSLEFSFFNYIVGALKDVNIETIYAKYIKTAKNEQVNDFYEKLGFEIVSNTDEVKTYRLDIKNYLPKNLEYIKVTYGK